MEPYWIFKINIFDCLYLILGPLIIFYAKPHMSFKKRTMIMFSAIFLSALLYISLIVYGKSLRWQEYHECVAALEPGADVASSCKRKPGLVMKLQEHSPFLGWALMAIFWFGYGMFLGGWHLVWYLYHRKTIKALGPSFRGKWLLFLTISSMLWWPFTPMFFVYSIFGLLDLWYWCTH